MRAIKIMFLVLLAVSFLLMPNGAQAEKTTLVYGTTEKLDSLEPHHMYTTPGFEILMHIHRMLVRFKPDTTDLELDLAESYAPNADNSEWTFKLKEGLKWPDGTPFNAEVVKRSMDRVASLGGMVQFLATDFVDHAEVVGEYEVKFVLKSPVAFFPALCAFSAYMPLNPNEYPMGHMMHWPSDLPGSKMVGLGPYMITSFKRDEEIILDANPDYAGPKPKTERIVIRYYADATTLRLTLEKGEADFVYQNLNPADIKDLVDSGKFNVYKRTTPLLRFITLQCQMPPTNNLAVRQALAAAVDRAAIARKTYLDQVTPTYSFVAQDWFPYVPAFKDLYGAAPDLAKAKDLLAQAGYSEENKLELELWYTPTTFGESEVYFATMVKDQWEATGLVSVSVQSAEWATFLERFNEKHDLTASLLAWNPDYIDPDNYLFAGSGAGAEVLGTMYNNEEYNEKLVQARAISDESKRKELYIWMERHWAVNVPIIPMFQTMRHAFSAKDVEGIKFWPSGALCLAEVYRK